MLQEDNVRKGFFERHEFEAVCTFLPEPYADIANFAYITGWRSSEIKDLQFRNLDFEAGEVRLEPGTTKSREGRAFPMFSELRVLLEKRLRLAQAERKKGVRCSHVFWYERNGEILQVGRFDKAWTTACRKAGLPDRASVAQKERRGCHVQARSEEREADYGSEG
jgi:integrase